MNFAIAVFAKTPELSPVKTRLAASIGEEKAKEFYEQSVASVEAILKDLHKTNNQISIHWTLAEQEAPNLTRWNSFPAIWTGEGGLGQRLANVSETLFKSHDAVMFLGTDSPQLSVEILVQAMALLEENSDKVITGPALDGGFFLFVSKNIVSRKIWEAVVYSDVSTLMDLETRLIAEGTDMIKMNPQQDVDTMDDLSNLRESLKNQEDDLLEPQRRLLEWLNDYFEVAV